MLKTVDRVLSDLYGNETGVRNQWWFTLLDLNAYQRFYNDFLVKDVSARIFPQFLRQLLLF